MTQLELEHTWRRLLAEQGAAIEAAWLDAPLRRFIHVGLEPLREIERAAPSSPEACAFFADNARRLDDIEDAAREQAGLVGARIRWRAAGERPYGAAPIQPAEHHVAAAVRAGLDEGAIAIDRIDGGAITMVAYGIACDCGDAQWTARPPHDRRHVRTSCWDRVDVETCVRCGATWLTCFYEDHFGNGSWYRGLVASALAATIEDEDTEALFEALPWYWEGGSYLMSATPRRARGAIRRR